MSRKGRMTLLWVGIYAVAMGWFEAAVVVYLRMLYYPGGFSFPLKVIPMEVGGVELVREAATLVMLLSVGVLAGRRPLEKFGYLMYAFGIWDIVYYIGLKVAIGWPASLLTWDLLFLLPLPWVGPVLAPVLVSLAMIAACVVIVYQQDRGHPLQPRRWAWAVTILGALVIIISFIVGYKTAFTSGVPDRFRWELFLLGYLPAVAVFVLEWRRAERGENTRG